MRTPLTHEVLASRAGPDEQQMRHRLELERSARLDAETELASCREQLRQARAELKNAQQGAEAESGTRRSHRAILLDCPPASKGQRGEVGLFVPKQPRVLGSQRA